MLATRFHVFYECPDNVTIDGGDDESRRRTASLAPEAREGWDSLACLRARAITPSDDCEEVSEAAFDEARVRSTPGLPTLLGNTRRCFSDGSGGVAGACSACSAWSAGA